MNAIKYENRSDGLKRTKLAQQEMLKIGDDFRARHPWLLRNQDSIGFAIFSMSCLAIVANAIAYAYEVIPAWLAVISAAFGMSLLHELEHDLIHYMYYRKNAFMHNLMMAGVWLFRPNTINPWVRRKLHLHHHKYSGTESDLEERGITNGEKWGLRRLLMTGDHMLAFALRPVETPKMMRSYIRAQGELAPREKRIMMLRSASGYFPLGYIFYGLWYGFIAWHASTFVDELFGHPVVLSAAQIQLEAMLNFLAVVLLVPNVVRVFCLHFVSSNMHYYGDVEPGNVIEQTQVWNAWWLAPLHFFCFNFGATHGIHHFVVRDTFYIRQLTAHKMYPVLEMYGVRFNDFGTLRRANRQNASRENVAAYLGSVGRTDAGKAYVIFGQNGANH